MRILTVIGARPQFIKAAMVSRELSKHSDAHELLLHTGQHYDAEMSEVFFEELSIPRPTYNLGLGGGRHGAMTGAQLAGIEQVILDEHPDCLLVYGDTNSTLAGALAAAKLGVPVAHVEAGLRSFNRRMPEEINRVLTDNLSSLLLAPTEEAMRNLSREGICGSRCHLVGDVMFDAARFFGPIARARASFLGSIGLEGNAYVLATIHRAENTDDPMRLRGILRGLRAVSESIEIVWPVHPRTRNVLKESSLAELVGPRMRLIDPVGYLDMVTLERSAALIATDSGGVQKEAFFHGVPCVTLRDETEWIELVESGWNTLASPGNSAGIADAIRNSIGKIGKEVSLYGEGYAARAIVKLLLDLPAYRGDR